ncbi:rab GTPase binding protein [Schizosaccharomyces japonicus yFS275]|uniref:Protein YIP n=1 Tax=Schizosaccharomyces japonicus (strain yFS275 / FY16936) TaxID=402676 RepID=B6K4V6_SCHJY|nr:rab GTPase binding protein [Schizosaccharomyces japonicus yFS275]EEB08513.2 rab GTPase binding protein [Schizosaccharomyces japonicus yFS275]
MAFYNNSANPAYFQPQYGQDAIGMAPTDTAMYVDDTQGEQLSKGWLAAFSTSGYPGEQTLLEELGINFGHIKQKTMTVLNPFRYVDTHIMDDTDLAGPVLFCLLFSTFLSLHGRSHFGYIYGVALLGSCSLHIVLRLMSPKSLSFLRTVSVLGYCLLPLVMVAFGRVLIDFNSLFGYIFTAISCAWCTYAASVMFVAILQLSDMRFLVAYPVFLFYAVFAVMTVFSN